jgi:hypothetical protein
VTRKITEIRNEMPGRKERETRNSDYEDKQRTRKIGARKRTEIRY